MPRTIAAVPSPASAPRWPVPRGRPVTRRRGIAGRSAVRFTRLWCPVGLSELHELARPLPREAAPPGAAPARRTAPAVHSGRVHRDRPRARRLPAPWGLPAPRLLPAVRDRRRLAGLSERLPRRVLSGVPPPGRRPPVPRHSRARRRGWPVSGAAPRSPSGGEIRSGSGTSEASAPIGVRGNPGAAWTAGRATGGRVVSGSRLFRSLEQSRRLRRHRSMPDTHLRLVSCAPSCRHGKAPAIVPVRLPHAARTSPHAAR